MYTRRIGISNTNNYKNKKEFTRVKVDILNTRGGLNLGNQTISEKSGVLILKEVDINSSGGTGFVIIGDKLIEAVSEVKHINNRTSSVSNFGILQLKKDFVIIGEYFNATLGRETVEKEKGRYIFNGERNKNISALIENAVKNKLITIDSFFPKRPGKQWTWSKPEGFSNNSFKRSQLKYEVLKAINCSGKSKQPALDRIDGYLLKHMAKSDKVLDFITHFFNLGWKTMKFPKSWGLTKVAPIFKKGSC
uniref:Beta_helix domain-containing protein n=1 Tax=Strongyloides venezuelensis TaxID=75913 RepID=A0A0K0EXP3_STRVS